MMWQLSNRELGRKYRSAENYCMSRSTILRSNQNSKWLIGEAASVMPLDKQALTTHLERKVRSKKGLSPFAVYILLYWVIPIVVRLILEWWFREGSKLA